MYLIVSYGIVVWRYLELEDELVEEGDEVSELFVGGVGHENLDAGVDEGHQLLLQADHHAVQKLPEGLCEEDEGNGGYKYSPLIVIHHFNKDTCIHN